MVDETTYHLSEHGSKELIASLSADLQELERRAQHYRARVPLRSAHDAQTVAAAYDALAQARATLAMLSAPAGPAREGTTDESDAAVARRRVLITGAGGRIGTVLAERLRNQYALRLMYHDRLPAQSPAADSLVADIARIDEVLPAMHGVEAVVHLAGDASIWASWESVLERNIIGTHNVFAAARQAGVRRIVFASTNHVMGMYDRDRQWPVYASQPIRPDSLYGVSKAFGEALGRFYVDQHGISVICLRIGWMLAEPRDDIARWMWLSPRDCAQIVARALDADLDYGVFYAISANSGRHWDITDTIEGLGYRPEDDAEDYFTAPRAAAPPTDGNT